MREGRYSDDEQNEVLYGIKIDKSALVGNVKDWICVIYNVENVCARNAWNERKILVFNFNLCVQDVKTFQVALTNL